MIGDKECLNCGKDLVHIAGKRGKIFCNATCRSNYWQKQDRKNKAGKATAKPPLATHRSAEGKDIDARIKDLEAELATIPDVGLGKKRRGFIIEKIKQLK